MNEKQEQSAQIATIDEAAEESNSGFFNLIVSRPVGLLVIFLTLIVIGVIAYLDIPIQMLPGGLQGTRLTVMVSHPGSGAQENETQVARVLEEQFRTLPNLDYIWSRSDEGNVRIGVGFSGDADMDLCKAELRDRVERARPQLPDTVDRIFVWARDDGDLPVMFFAVLQKKYLPATDYLVESRIQRRLERVEGVSSVEIWGMLDDSIRILLDEDKVRAARLDLGALVRRLSTDNFTQPLGEINDGGRQFLLRSDMRFKDLSEVGNYPIGGGMRLNDVARIERVKTVRDRLTRIDGQTAYYGMVQKESTANTVKVGRALEEAVAEIALDPALAANLSVQPLFNQADFIENSLNAMRQTALFGGGLAILVLFAFLRRWRMTLSVALSIPVSALLSVAYVYFTGGTFNILTMTGLTLGIGMLVDNSVVVIENIARLRLQGYTPKRAAIDGTRDVALAIGLATLTSVVVFLPLIFMGDNPRMKIMLGALGLPLCVSLLLSLMVALVFLPVLAARILGDRPAPVELAARSLAPLVALPVRLLAAVIGLLNMGFYGLIHVMHRVNRACIGALTPLRYPLACGMIGLAAWSYKQSQQLNTSTDRLHGLGVDLSSRESISGAMVGAIISGIAGVLLLLLGVPRWKRGSSSAPARPTHFRPRGDSVLAWIQRGNGTLLRWTLEHRFLATLFSAMILGTILYPQSNMTVTAFGQDEDNSEIEIDIDLESNFTLAETSEEFLRYEEFFEQYREDFGFAHLVSRFRAGRGDIELRWEERQDPDKLARFRERLRIEVPKLAGHELRFGSEQGMDSTSRQYVQFQLRGTNAEALERYGKEALAILERVPGLTDISSPLEEAPEQVRLLMDSDTAYRYGVTPDVALRSVSWALRGAQLPRYQEAGREIPFIIEYDTERLAGLDTLRDIDVFAEGTAVPLTSFSKIEFQKGRRSIFRWNGQTTFNIQARVSNPNRQLQVVEAGYAALEGLQMPRGFSLGRDNSAVSRQADESSVLMKAMGLSVVLVLLLMAILFESLLLPFSVLVTIPFAVVGSWWTLYLTGTSLDSVGYIGLIILFGVVVNNGIVLIDKVHRLRANHDRKTAIIEGASARVRPILMTALTTIIGLMPMALGEAARDGIDYRALATIVAGGLAFSTVFTLWTVPLAYSLLEDLGQALEGLKVRVFRLFRDKDEGDTRPKEVEPASSFDDLAPAFSAESGDLSL